MRTIGKARRLSRLMNKNSQFSIVAMDQRAILTNVLAELKNVAPDALPFSDVLAVKRLLVETLAEKASAMLFDPNIAVPAAIAHLPRDTGLVVALEDHRVEDTGRGRKTNSIVGWSVEKIQRLGADAVKLLVWYNPDAAPDVRLHQQNYVRAVAQECARHEMPFILELLTFSLEPDGASADRYTEFQGKRSELVLRSVEEFSKPRYLVDLFKLESPIPAKELGPFTGNEADPAFADVGAICAEAGIPWVLLSGGGAPSQFMNVLDHAYAAGASGFLAGRAIWLEPIRFFPDLERCRQELKTSGRKILERLIDRTLSNARGVEAWSKDSFDVGYEGEFALSY